MREAALSYRVEGHGPPLLLVHGFVISYNIWRNLLPLLRPHFTLVMIQLPGSGESALQPEGCDYTSAAIDGIEGVRLELGLKSWDVLGYSSGSRIAEAYVQAHPEDVCRAVFVCPVEVHGFKLHALRTALSLDKALPATGNWALSGWRLKFLISLFGFNLQPDPLGEEWFREISAAPMRVLKETIRAVARFVDMPYSVPVPFALIWADRDLVPSRSRLGPRDQIVHGQHAAPVEAAGQVAAAILSLWNSSPQPEESNLITTAHR